MPTDLPTASRLLLTGPAGSGKTQQALDRIQAAATVAGERGRGASDPDAALLIVPTYAHALHMKRLVLSRFGARGIFDAPFTTFTSAGERFLAGFRVRSIPSADERDRLMEEALRRADVPLFRTIADRVGFRAHLLRLVKEVKQSGLPVDEALGRLAAGEADLKAVARDRLSAFRAVFSAYDALLHEARLADHEDSLRELLAALGDAVPQNLPGTLVVDGFDDFTPVEERILERLAGAVTEAGGEVLITLPFAPARPDLFPGAEETRRRWRGRGFTEHALSGFARSEQAGLRTIATRLFAGAQEPTDPAPGVSMLVAGDAEDEAEQVAREIRRLVEAARDDVPGAVPVRGWRGVGVVLRRVDDAAERYESAFARMGVPLRVMGGGRRLGSAPLVRALRGPLALLAGRTEAGRFDARALTAWMRWRTAWDNEAFERRTVDEWEIDHRDLGFPVGWAEYMTEAPATLQPFIHELTAAIGTLRDAGTGPQVYRALGQAIEILTPLPESAGVDDDGFPLDPEGDARLARATAAQVRLVSILGGLESAVARTGLGEAIEGPNAVDELLDAIERSRLTLSDRRLDAVTLMDAEEARYWELDVVVVAGLEAGAFPLRPREDVLLRDADRKRLAEGGAALRLPLARDREERERRLFYGAVTRARHQLILARSAYDEDGDPKGPSFFLRDVERVVTPAPLGAVPRPGRVSVALARCVSPRDLRLFAAAAIADPVVPDAQRRVARALLDVVGSTAEMRAASATRPRADVLRGAGDDLPDWMAERFAAGTARVSASSLTKAVRCPYQHFLASLVGVPEDDVPFDGPSFDLRKEGTALHKSLELALARPDDEPAAIADDVVTELDLDDVEARLLHIELARAVTLFRRREADTAGPLKPDIGALELAFGGRGEVALGSGDGRFELRGRIDRLDTGRGIASIIDYKSSVSASAKAAKAAQDHTDLQLPLYALALMQLRGLDVRGIEWMTIRARDRRVLHEGSHSGMFASRKESVGLKAFDAEAWSELLDGALAAAEGAVRGARAGRFPKAPTKKISKYCDSCAYFDVCRPDKRDPESREVVVADAGEDA